MGFLSSIFGKGSSTADFSGYVDHHSHILPAVDDGFRSLETSLECLDRYKDYGVSELWLTPHVMEDFPNATDDLRRRFDELSNAYTGPIKLHLASENMIDMLFDRRLEANDFLPMGKYLLVETSYYGAPSNFDEAIAGIKSLGYFPLLAHPERYRYMDDRDYDRLLADGVTLQLNIFSLIGMYGLEARDKALRLLKRNAYTLSGSDIHNLRQTEGLDRLLKDHKLVDKILALRQSDL